MGKEGKESGGKHMACKLVRGATMQCKAGVHAQRLENLSYNVVPCLKSQSIASSRCL